MKEAKRKALPKLPRGEGSLQWHNDRVMYRKVVRVGTGSHRLCVYGDTAREAMQKMREEEEHLLNRACASKSTTLAVDMENWLTLWKAPALKPSSYDRIETTFEHQIKPYQIARIRWSELNAADLQRHINNLVQENLSYSTVKKVYDLLNSYYNWKVDNDYLERSPMRTVNMPAEDNMLKKTKEIQYLKKNEIATFIEEARRCYSTGEPVYSMGEAFIFLLYTGLRIGEAIALRWRDIDFERRTVTVSKNLGYIKNREDGSDTSKKKVLYLGSTKTKKIRVVALNDNALEAIDSYRSQTAFTHPDDYVFCTRNGSANTQTNMEKRLNTILENSGVEIGKCGCHMLRHTCASLLFDNGIPVELIAAILGHSPDVCRKTYVHFCQEQQAAAIHRIDEFVSA